MTYTYVHLPVSAAAYDEIKKKLEDAGYRHAFNDEGADGVVIDMHGLALQRMGETTAAGPERAQRK